ncbi:hypothetical protein DFJ74DRAFT_726390, partial [Hyaloraphidium curvatum]
CPGSAAAVQRLGNRAIDAEGTIRGASLRSRAGSATSAPPWEPCASAPRASSTARIARPTAPRRRFGARERTRTQRRRRPPRRTRRGLSPTRSRSTGPRAPRPARPAPRRCTSSRTQSPPSIPGPRPGPTGALIFAPFPPPCPTTSLSASLSGICSTTSMRRTLRHPTRSSTPSATAMTWPSRSCWRSAWRRACARPTRHPSLSRSRQGAPPHLRSPWCSGISSGGFPSGPALGSIDGQPGNFEL